MLPWNNNSNNIIIINNNNSDNNESGSNVRREINLYGVLKNQQQQWQQPKKKQGDGTMAKIESLVSSGTWKLSRLLGPDNISQCVYTTKAGIEHATALNNEWKGLSSRHDGGRQLESKDSRFMWREWFIRRLLVLLHWIWDLKVNIQTKAYPISLSSETLEYWAARSYELHGPPTSRQPDKHSNIFSFIQCIHSHAMTSENNN